MSFIEINEALRLLGAPERQAVLETSNGTVMHRTIWACGCSVDQISTDEAAVQWARCGGHERKPAPPQSAGC